MPPANNEESTVVPMVSRAGRLADALARARARQEAEVREAFEQREDRMATLAHELDAMADELPEGEAGQFELIASHTGERLVIDPLSYVDLDENSNDYRLIRQRRDGEETCLSLQTMRKWLIPLRPTWPSGLSSAKDALRQLWFIRLQNQRLLSAKVLVFGVGSGCLSWVACAQPSPCLLMPGRPTLLPEGA